MKVGFIGGGNMASALMNGLLESGKVQAKDVLVADLDKAKLLPWQERGVQTTRDNTGVEKECDVVFFAVKPNIMDRVLEQMEGREDRIYLSIAAGITLTHLESKLGSKCKIIRTMPNTPAMVGCGMTVITPNVNVTVQETEMVEALFSGVGDSVVLAEEYMNAAIALHSSSPAYIYMLIDAMADGGVRYGIPKAIALKLAAKAVEGSAKMVLKSPAHPEQLKDQVCSPGGTTIAAVCDLERTGFRASVQSAIEACVRKAESMSQ